MSYLLQTGGKRPNNNQTLLIKATSWTSLPVLCYYEAVKTWLTKHVQSSVDILIYLKYLSTNSRNLHLWQTHHFEFHLSHWMCVKSIPAGSDQRIWLFELLYMNQAKPDRVICLLWRYKIKALITKTSAHCPSENTRARIHTHTHTQT